ncbi:hypothetical protein NM045_2212 [Neisseria meningitidis NM045]|nr:hypothetical protein NM045_2212 [Neisseria meningitidis NM045]
MNFPSYLGQLQSLLSLNEITDKTLFKENVVYRFSKY